MVEPAATIYFYFVQVVASTLFISSTGNRYFPDCTESLNKGEAFFQIEVTYVLLTGRILEVYGRQKRSRLGPLGREAYMQVYMYKFVVWLF